MRPHVLATRGAQRLQTEVIDGLEALKAATTALQGLAVRCDAPVTGCLPWILASAQAALAVGTADHVWALILRDDDGLACAAAMLLEARTRGGPTLRLAGAEGGYRTSMLAVDAQAAAALAEALVARLNDRQRGFRLALGPVDEADPVLERLSATMSDWSLDGSREIPVVTRAGPSEATEYLSPIVRRTLRKARNRLAADGVDAQITFTRERHRILRLLPGMSLAYRDRDAARGVGTTAPLSILRSAVSPDDEPGWPLFAARIKALAGQGGMEVATLHLDGELAAYAVGFDDRKAYRVMDGGFVGSWARYSPGRLLETAVLQRMIDDPGKSTLDWMTAIAPDTLLTVNQVQRVVTLRMQVEPLLDRRRFG